MTRSGTAVQLKDPAPRAGVLAGKPVLDMAVAVSNEWEADACIVPLVSPGCEHRGAHGDGARRGYLVLEIDGVRVMSAMHLPASRPGSWTL